METIAVLFGGRSVEHEVSVVTALQVMENLNRQKYDILPIYISKAGVWYSDPSFTKIETFRKDHLDTALSNAGLVHWDPSPGNVVRLERQGAASEKRGWFNKGKAESESREVSIDAVIPALHGTYGEDGAVQGFLELTGVPYTSAGVVGSAVGMDKIVMKSVFAGVGIPIVSYEWLSREQWRQDPERWLQQITEKLTFPLFVKPCNLGSSVGITRAESLEELRTAIEIAAHYDTRILVEQGVDGAVEINVSVIGDELEARPSLCERPVTWEKFLTYDDKYIRGNFNKSSGAAREIPAQLPEGMTERIQKLACRAFSAVHAKGVARIDFLISEAGEVYVNEINTIPGSFSFYLWEPTGLSYSRLLDELLDIAKRTATRKRENIVSFDSELLEKFGQGGKLGASKMGKM